MADKATHFGRAGEFFAMSELLLRGWNVAVPVVDVGDDAFVVDDNDKSTYRLQVKSADPRIAADGSYSASFALSRRQLRVPLEIELFYIFLMRVEDHWTFLVVPRDELASIRDRFEVAPRTGPGRTPVSDARAKTDTLQLSLDVSAAGIMGWGARLDRFVGQWPAQLGILTNVPGKRAR